MWDNIRGIPSSIPLGRLFGIPVRLHLTFFALLGIQLLFSIHAGAPAVLLWFILLGPILLFTILMHELGHCLAARSVGGVAESILLWPLGGLAFIGHTAGPKADMWVAFAGPLTHVPMVGMWVIFLLPAYHAATGSWAITLEVPYPDSAAYLGQAVCASAVIMNIALFAFNLLVPAYPLDGGRMLVDGLLLAGVAPRTTAIVTMVVATAMAAGILVYGIIFFEIITILVAAFILFANFQLFRAWQTDSLAQHPLFAATGARGPDNAPNMVGSVDHVPNPPGPYYQFGHTQAGSASNPNAGKGPQVVGSSV